jgi:hypothetical protein
MCACIYMSEAYAHSRLLRGDACMCGSVCLGLDKARAHGDCCEAMHACVSFVWVCPRRVLTVISTRRCMHVWECVSELGQGAWSL